MIKEIETMKVVILGGAAHMAKPAVHYLAKKNEIKKIVLADLNFDKVNEFAIELGAKATAQAVDVNDKQDLVRTISGANLVMNFIGPYYQFGTKTLETVIEEGIHYVDICDDYDTTEEALKLSKKAEGKGVTALIGMGASPGITNVLARLGSDAVERVEEINTYWVVGDAEPGGFGALIHLFHCIEGKIPTFRNGNFENIRPYQMVSSKEVDFGKPVGKVRLYHVGHPEPVTLPRFIPNVKTVTNFGAILPEYQNLLFKTLVDFGMASEQPITFRKEKVAPLEFLLALIKHKQSNHAKNPRTERKSMAASRIEVIGTTAGEKVSYTFTKSSYETMAESTSMPAGVAAWQILKKQINIKGVIPPECIDPKKLLFDMQKAGSFEKGNEYEVIKQTDSEVVKSRLFESELFK